MNSSELTASVLQFAQLTAGIQDEALDLEWTWGDYDEGLRMAFFRTYAQLRELTVRVGTGRASAGRALSTAQRVMGQYQAAFRDLQAVLLGVGDEQAERIPAKDEWSVNQTVLHMLQTESLFLPVVMKGIYLFRQGEEQASGLSDEEYEVFWHGTWVGQDDIRPPLAELMEAYNRLHERVLHEMNDIQETELDAPSVYWESQPMPALFRLHRFDAHLRQHTVQVEKALAATGVLPLEAKRLLRLLYNALAECEAIQFGLPAEVEAALLLALEIRERSVSVLDVLEREKS